MKNFLSKKELKAKKDVKGYYEDCANGACSATCTADCTAECATSCYYSCRSVCGRLVW